MRRLARIKSGLSMMALHKAMPKRDMERERALTEAARKMARKIRPKLKRRMANG